jgi:hypothetical protein
MTAYDDLLRADLERFEQLRNAGCSDRLTPIELGPWPLLHLAELTGNEGAR